MRLIIVLRGHHPSTHPHHIGGFDWSPEHGCYVWQGREFEPREFNEVIDGVLKANRDLWAHPVTVRAVGRKTRNGRAAEVRAAEVRAAELQGERAD